MVEIGLVLTLKIYKPLDTESCITLSNKHTRLHKTRFLVIFYGSLHDK